MSKGAVNFNEEAVEYYTPKALLDYFGPFDYDPATTPERAKYHHISNFDTKETDGLKQDWTPYSRIWINPPFNIKILFWQKAVETYRKAHNQIFFLCPIEFLPTIRFQNTNQPFTLYLPRGRVKFEHTAGGGDTAKSPAFGSVIISPSDTYQLELIPKDFK